MAASGQIEPSTVPLCPGRLSARDRRRAKITPQQAGLPAFGGGHRRVPGLRREEVALLAGVSIDYYARLERGQLAGASEEVLDAVCRALQLDEAERAHLHDLAAAQRHRPPRRAAPPASRKPPSRPASHASWTP